MVVRPEENPLNQGRRRYNNPCSFLHTGAISGKLDIALAAVTELCLGYRRACRLKTIFRHSKLSRHSACSESSAAIRVLAIGSKTRPVARGETLFRAGDTADAGYVVQQGALRVSAEDGGKHEIIAGPGTLVGELALIAEMKRPATVTAIEDTVTICISRSLFQKVLESDPALPRAGSATILRNARAMRVRHSMSAALRLNLGHKAFESARSTACAR